MEVLYKQIEIGTVFINIGITNKNQFKTINILPKSPQNTNTVQRELDRGGCEDPIEVTNPSSNCFPFLSPH